MTKVIALANQKGGVGKSTLCIQLAFYLAEQKRKVLVLDFDAQGNTSSRLALVDGDDGRAPVFSGTPVSALFADTLPELQITECPCGVDLFHTPKNDPVLAEIESKPLEVAANPSQHLREFISQYDYVIIDCPPSLGRKLVAALMFATDVVCPVKLSGFAVDGVEGLINTILGIQHQYNEALNILGIIINDMDDSVNHAESYQELRDEIPDLLFENIIKHRPPLDTATTKGIPVWQLRYGHVAAKEVRSVLDEIIERVG